MDDESRLEVNVVVFVVRGKRAVGRRRHGRRGGRGIECSVGVVDRGEVGSWVGSLKVAAPLIVMTYEVDTCFQVDDVRLLHRVVGEEASHHHPVSI